MNTSRVIDTAKYLKALMSDDVECESVNCSKLRALLTPHTWDEIEELCRVDSDSHDSWLSTIMAADSAGYVKFYPARGVWCLTEKGEEYVALWN